MDRPSLASSLVNSLFAQPVLCSLRKLAAASHTSAPGTCSFSLPMPLQVYCFIAPGTGLPHAITEFIRPQYAPLSGPASAGSSGPTVLEPPALQLQSQFSTAVSLEKFLGRGWNSFTIQEDSPVGGMKVSSSSRSLSVQLHCVQFFPFMRSLPQCSHWHPFRSRHTLPTLFRTALTRATWRPSRA